MSSISQEAVILRHGALRLQVLVIGSAVIVALLFATFLLYRSADPSRIDTAALDREEKNAPYIPSSPQVVDKMIKMAKLKPRDLVYDLGCGDGRILIAAARASGCRAVGYEIDPELVEIARANVEEAGLQELVTIEERDIFTVSLHEADVVMVYLLPWMLEKLIPQFDEMKPGARIVAHDFLIAGCKPDESVEVWSDPNKVDQHHVHLWIVPLKKGTAPR